METAYIVSYARTPLARSYKGALKNVPAPSLFGLSIKAAIAKTEIDTTTIDDVIMGCALPEGSQYYNIGRLSSLAAGLPESVPGMTVDRQCSSGLMTAAIGAMQINTGQANIIVAGGGEHLSMVQNEHMNTHNNRDSELKKISPSVYMSMLKTAEIVASKYDISRSEQDEFALLSQQRTSAQSAKEIHQQEMMSVDNAFINKFANDEEDKLEAPLNDDQCPRSTTTIEALESLNTVIDSPEATVTAGNACCFSDGSAALVLANKQAIQQYQLQPMAKFLGVAVAGCPPEEMGIGPVFAVPKLLNRFNLKIEDIDIWELNEAFASQALYCIKQLNLDPNKVNINGGAIALGHPYGMTGTRMTGSALLQGRKQNAKYAVITMCIGGGQGAAGLIEIIN